MHSWGRRAAAACLAALAFAGSAAAHEMRPLIATLIVEDRAFELVVTLNLEAAIAGIGAGHDETAESPAAPTYDRLRALPPAALEAELAGFEQILAGRIELAFDGERVPLRLARSTIPEVGEIDLARVSALVLEGEVPGGSATVGWRVDERLGHSVIRVLHPDDPEAMQSAFVEAGETAGPFALAEPVPVDLGTVLLDYLRVGFVHIVPYGLDHILFVVGLFLLSTRLSSLVWQVSAFTLAHTVTLALGATGVVNLPASIVEPLIAASIVYVAVENVLTDRLHRWRPLVVFCFGLLHGLGFAGVLGEVGLPPGLFVAGLLAFNVGVELGQLAVIAVCFAAVGFYRNSPSYRRAVVVPGSVVIAAVGAFWLVERTGLV